MSTEDNVHLVRNVAEVAAAAAATAVREENGRRRSQVPIASAEDEIPFGVDAASHGGHDAPNWSRSKSSVILLGATVLYAIIAEILVNTVDVVLENVDVEEKFLGMTLFALVPNTTEFLVSILHKVYLGDQYQLSPLECHFFRYEREYCSQYGDWFGIRTPSVPVTDSCPCSFQCLVRCLSSTRSMG